MRLVSSQTILSTALMMYYIWNSHITSTQCHVPTCTKAVNVGRIARIFHHAGGFSAFLCKAADMRQPATAVSDCCRGCLSCKCLLLQEEIMQLKCTLVFEFYTENMQGCLLFLSEPVDLSKERQGKRFWFWVTGESKHSFSSRFCDFKHIDEET